MRTLSGRFLLAQLKADLIGKDAYRGVTLTYSWLANQFGHFSLGFIPSLILFVLLYRMGLHLHAFWAPAFVAVAWLLFEVGNLLWPLLKGGQCYVFSPAWGNLIFDTFTDLLFFWFGTAAAACLILPNVFTSGLLIASAASILFPSKFWYKTKCYQQLAGYPFQQRLSQWQYPISATDKTTVLDFAAKAGCGHHLLIYGGRRTGKTSLAVAIANERSIARQACTYFTGMKLYPLFCLGMEDTQTMATAPWNWRGCQWLVIDDLNPGPPVAEEMVAPPVLEKLWNSHAATAVLNKAVLREANVVWVLGNESLSGTTWPQMLAKMGVPEAKISAVHLGHVVAER